MLPGSLVSPLFVSSGGFKDWFRAAAENLGQPLVLWTLEDLF